MARVLMLWPAGAGVRIGSTEAAQLGALGVTNVTVLGDAESVAVVIEGWAFDPDRSVRDAAVSLGGTSEYRVLRTSLDLAVSNVDRTGGKDGQALAISGSSTGSRVSADG